MLSLLVVGRVWMVYFPPDHLVAFQSFIRQREVPSIKSLVVQIRLFEFLDHSLAIGERSHLDGVVAMDSVLDFIATLSQVG